MQPVSQSQTEVQVLLTEEARLDQPGELWRAVVLQMPHLKTEGQSREQVLSAIKNLLTQSVRHAEIVTLSLTNGSETADPIAAQGYRHYGIFADDPEALKLFDEIEEERNKHLIEPNQS